MSVGRADLRRDAAAKVTGAARYPADGWPAGALHAKVVFSNQPHARMLAFDLSVAEAVPGVVAVLGAADVPVNEYGLTMFDQPVLVGLGSSGRSPLQADVSRWEADHVAVVVAETVDAAAAGAAAVAVEWEPLPVVGDLDAALRGDVLVHPEHGLGSNVYTSYRIRKGDVDAGWAAAEVVVEGTYEVPYQEHAYLQPEAALSYVDAEGRVTVEIAGQWAHEDQAQIAHALDLPLDAVRVIYPTIGGAFGGREDMSLQIVMALAAMRLAERGEHRPIAARWSREESIVGHHKRHRGRVHARLGATRDGRITVVEADAWLDAGAYNYTSNKVLGNMHLGLAGPYEVPNARIDSHAVYTNATPGGAFRGFGAPQATFVAETQVNRLAAELGIDPVEVRRRNLLHDGSVGITQTPMPAGRDPAEGRRRVRRRRRDRCPAGRHVGPGAPAARPFATLAAAPGAVRRGRGFACAFKNVGFSFGFPERCEAEIVLHGGDGIERVDLHHAGADVGQGAHQAFLQMAAEAVGVDVDLVEGHFSDTATSGDSGSASASRLTWMAGNAILGAAEEAEKAWRDGRAPRDRAVPLRPAPDRGPRPRDGRRASRTSRTATWRRPSRCRWTWRPATSSSTAWSTPATWAGPSTPPSSSARSRAASCRPTATSLTEDLRSEAGRLVNPRLSTYLIPGIRDIPRTVESVVLELADPLGPFGVRGMAEMPMIPYAAAVVAAVHDATGRLVHEVPAHPERGAGRPRRLSCCAAVGRRPGRRRAIRAPRRRQRRWMRSLTERWRASISSSRGDTSAPSSTTGRPATTVWWAATGPHRSHPSTRSSTTPAKAGPVSRHATRSPAAPTDSSPSSPCRPRHAAPSLVAISSAALAPMASAPLRSLARSMASRASCHSGRGVRRRGAVAADPDRGAGGPQVDHRGDARRQDQVGAGAVGDAHAGAAEPGDLGGVGADAVRHPGAVAHPADVLEQVDGPAPEGGEGEFVVLVVLGEVGVEPDVEALGERGGVGHQLGCDGERRARGESEAHHRTVGGVVVPGDEALGRGEDLVVVAHDVVGRQPAVLLGHVHRAMGGVEAHAEVAGGLDLGADQVAGAFRVEVQVVGGGRAAAEGQLGQTHPRRDVGGLLVDAAPLRVQRLQPAEQRRRRHRRPRPGQVLEEVVVGVHQARCDEAPGRAEGASRRRRLVAPTAQRGDQAAVDRHPAAPQLTPVTVDRRHHLGVPDQEVHRARIRHDADSGSR